MSDLRAQTLEAFHELTGLRLTRLVQRGRDSDTARFILQLADGREVRVGNFERLSSRAQFNRVIGVACGTFARPCKPAVWENAVHALVMHATEVTEVDDELLERRLLDWLDRYARGAATADRDGAAAQRMPFIEEDRLYVSVDHLAVWVRQKLQEQIREHELRAALRDLGFDLRQINYNTAGQGTTRRRTSARYYCGPLTILDGASDVE